MEFLPLDTLQTQLVIYFTIGILVLFQFWCCSVLILFESGGENYEEACA